MKATLKFSLPDDNLEFKIASQPLGWWSTLYDFNQHLRSKLKYETLTEQEYEIYDSIREKLFELMRDNNISFNE